ncbi:MAG: DUF4340 domain-containing protein, partial [Candidatus Ratteibacteria bacterium]
MRIFKKNIFLFIIMLFLFLYYFYENKTSSEREKMKSESKRIFKVEKDKIKSIFIKNGEKEIEIVKSDGLWVIKDKNYQCDKNEVENLINKIANLEFEREIEGISDFSLYGLEKPEKVIKIEENGEKYILYVGNETPTGSYLYVTKDKINVFLVYKWDINEIIEKNIFDLRDKRIIPVDIFKSDIEEIEIKKGKKILSFFKKGENWYIKTPIEDWASKEKIEKIMNICIMEGIVSPKQLIDKEILNNYQEWARLIKVIRDKYPNY